MQEQRLAADAETNSRRKLDTETVQLRAQQSGALDAWTDGHEAEQAFNAKKRRVHKFQRISEGTVMQGEAQEDENQAAARRNKHMDNRKSARLRTALRK